MLWDPDGFPKKYYDERIQFQKLYDWLKDNIEIQTKVNFDDINLSSQSSFQWYGTAKNDYDIEEITTIDLRHTITKEDTTTITYGKRIGYEYNSEFNVKCLFGAIKYQHKVNVNLNKEQCQTTVNKEELTFGAIQEIKVLPYSSVIAVCTLTPFQGTGKGAVTVTTTQKNPSAFCRISMNYGSWDLKINNLPLGDRTYTYSIDNKLTEYVFDIVWKPTTTNSMIPPAATSNSLCIKNY